MPDVGAPELIIILVVVLIIFGPGKLPDLGRTLGSSIREMRNSLRGDDETHQAELAPPAEAAPLPPVTPAPAPIPAPQDAPKL